MNKELFKNKLIKLQELRQRNCIVDDTIKEQVLSDFNGLLFSLICEDYETAIIELLSALWVESEIIKDWIYYLLFEIDDSFKNNVLVKNGDTEMEYTVNDIDTLCDFLFKEYKMIGE